MWWMKAVNTVIGEEVSRGRTAFTCRGVVRWSSILFRIWKGITTAFIFRSFGFLKKTPHLLSIVYSPVVETVLLTAFYVSELMYSAVIILKKNDCLAPYFFQEAFVWQVDLLRSWQKVSRSSGGNPRSEEGLEAVVVSSDSSFDFFSFILWFSDLL